MIGLGLSVDFNDRVMPFHHFVIKLKLHTCHACTKVNVANKTREREANQLINSDTTESCWPLYETADFCFGVFTSQK